MDAFPDYTKFKETKKVLAAISVITEVVDNQDDKREACQETEITAKDSAIDVIFDNNGNEKSRKVTVSGNDIVGSGNYDETLFGVVDGNATEIDVVWPAFVAADGKYRIVQQNPALGAYFSDDPSVKGNVKTKEYTGEDLLEGYAILLTDKTGIVNVKLYDITDAKNEVLVQSLDVDNKISFQKSYIVKINNKPDSGVTIDAKALNEDAVTGDFDKVHTGDKICLTLSGPADVAAIGGSVEVDVGNIYTITVESPASGTILINISKED